MIPLDNIKSAIGLDWDHNHNSIFWSDVEKDTINRAYLNGSHQTVIVNSNLSKIYCIFVTFLSTILNYKYENNQLTLQYRRRAWLTTGLQTNYIGLTPGRIESR